MNQIVPETPAVRTSVSTGGRLNKGRTSILTRLDMLSNETVSATDEKIVLDGYRLTPLHSAASTGDFRRLAVLLHGPEQQQHISQRDETGWLPLHHAACAGRQYTFLIPLGNTNINASWVSFGRAVLEDVCSLVERVQRGEVSTIPAQPTATNPRNPIPTHPTSALIQTNPKPPTGCSRRGRLA